MKRRTAAPMERASRRGREVRYGPRMAMAVFGSFAGLFFIGGVQAHEGPPFPILDAQALGAYRASVWADPDVGIATFYLVLEGGSGGGDHAAIDKVEVGVQPLSGRIAEAWTSASPMQVRKGQRYVAEVPLDRAEPWRVRVVVRSGDRRDVLQSTVNATADATFGPVGIALYSAPFLGVGVLWLLAILRKKPQAHAGSSR